MKALPIRIAVAVGLATALASCYVYDPYYPYGYVSPQAAFDRYWNAALGGMRDAGMQVTVEDRAAGVIRSVRGATTMEARVIPQADGTVRVEFNAGGKLSEDPGMPERVTRAYDARLGR